MRGHPRILWLRVSCVAFAFATAYALAVVMMRLPGFPWGDPLRFRIALVMHVELAVFVWLMSSMAGQWVRQRDTATPATAWGPGLALAGVLLLVAAPLAGGTPVMADYFPWLEGNPWFSLGIMTFSVAVALTAVATLFARHNGKERPTLAADRLAAIPVLAAVATLLGDAVHGAADPLTLAWGTGHVLLFAHVAMMLWEWSEMSGSGQRASNCAASVLALSSVAMACIPWWHPPGSPEHRILFTQAMTWLLWPPAMVVWLKLLRHLLARRQFPAIGLALSLSLFPLGLLLGTLIDGQTTLVTAHYHAAVGAVALSRMAYFYHANLTLRDASPTSSSQRGGQLITYWAGLLLLVTGLVVASVAGSPRKASAPESAGLGSAYRVGMTIGGVGGLFALAGSLWLVGNLMGSRRRHAAPLPPAYFRQKCHDKANTASDAAASSHGMVQS